MDGHERYARRDILPDAKHRPGSASSALHADLLGILQQQGLRIRRMDAHIWPVEMSIELVNERRLRPRVPMALHPSGGEKKREFGAGALIRQFVGTCPEPRLT